ncbi:class I SAM-dependent methyltransferase [Candidatus Woesearchaeota archaeon]|nr:class I SAM-dependent methyltransferase [Candidatus Woesearchaeota archaeon]
MNNSEKLKKNRIAYNEEFYDEMSDSSYNSAKIYLGHLWKYMQPVSVLDVGCGRGAWLKACHEYGSRELLGFDGEWNSQSMMIDKDIKYKSIDLNRVFNVEKRVDLAMSLEVAEHLNPTLSNQFVNCLTESSDAILFSAAYCKQGGTEHINENKHSYWAKIFSNYNYVPFDLFRPTFWGDTRVGFWYRQNTFLYVKNDSDIFNKLQGFKIKEIDQTDFMNCVHPDLYNLKCGEGLGFSLHAKHILPSLFKAVKRRLVKS